MIPSGLATLALCVALPPVGLTGQTPTREPEIDPVEVRTHSAGMAAHHLCAGVFVVGRDHRRPPERVLAEDITRFPFFN